MPFLQVKPTTQMSKVFQAYSQRVGTPKNTLKFFLNGKRVAETATPASLELEEDDVVSEPPGVATYYPDANPEGGPT